VSRGRRSALVDGVDAGQMPEAEAVVGRLEGAGREPARARRGALRPVGGIGGRGRHGAQD
jgi:hypothetical protein